MFLNDAKMRDLVKKAVPKETHQVLAIEECTGEYWVTNSVWLFRVNPVIHPKTMKALGKLLEVPEVGSGGMTTLGKHLQEGFLSRTLEKVISKQGMLPVTYTGLLYKGGNSVFQGGNSILMRVFCISDRDEVVLIDENIAQAFLGSEITLSGWSKHDPVVAFDNEGCVCAVVAPLRQGDQLNRLTKATQVYVKGDEENAEDPVQGTQTHEEKAQ